MYPLVILFTKLNHEISQYFNRELCSSYFATCKVLSKIITIAPHRIAALVRHATLLNQTSHGCLTPPKMGNKESLCSHQR